MKTVAELDQINPLRPIQTRLANGQLLLACKSSTGEWWSSWNPGIVDLEDLVEYSSAHQDESWLGWEILVALPVPGPGSPDFDAINDRLAAATPGEWLIVVDHGETMVVVDNGQFPRTLYPLVVMGDDPDDANAQLIANARADIAALLEHTAHVDELIAAWRSDPVIHLDPDGTVRIDMHRVEEREGVKAAEQRARAELAERRLRQHRDTGDYESGVEYGTSLATDRFMGLIESMADPNPCHLDKNGNCIAHGFDLAPDEKCPELEARELIQLYHENNNAAASS